MKVIFDGFKPVDNNIHRGLLGVRGWIGLRTPISGADAVLVGAGAGLSTAAGFSYAGKRFDDNFADFRDAFGITDMYSGGFYPFPDQESLWAWWSRSILLNRYDCPVGKPYLDLLHLLRGREYFVLTTNVDHQFQRAGIDRDRLFYMQGNYGLLQCSRPCHQATYDNEELVRQMAERQNDLRVPSELVPRCPRRGRPWRPTCAATTRSWRMRAGMQPPGATTSFSIGIAATASCFWKWAWAATRRPSSSIRSGAWRPRTATLPTCSSTRGKCWRPRGWSGRASSSIATPLRRFPLA